MDDICFNHYLTHTQVLVRDAIIGKTYISWASRRFLGILSYKRYIEPTHRSMVGKYRCKFENYNSVLSWNDVLIEVNI